MQVIFSIVFILFVNFDDVYRGNVLDIRLHFLVFLSTCPDLYDVPKERIFSLRLYSLKNHLLFNSEHLRVPDMPDKARAKNVEEWYKKHIYPNVPKSMNSGKVVRVSNIETLQTKFPLTPLFIPMVCK